MIKIETKKGTTSVEASGSNAELYADACVIVRCVYKSLNEELKNKNVAEEFKKACIDGSIFDEDDNECKLGMLKAMLDDLIKQIGESDKDE